MNDIDAGVEGFVIGVVLTGVAMLLFCDRIVTPDEISRAEKICENANSELAWFETNTIEIEVTCNNAATFVINPDESVKIDTTIEAEPTQSEVNKNE